jgi:hypothetical protein
VKRLIKIGRTYLKFVLVFAAVFPAHSALYAEERIVNLEASVDYSEIGIQDTLELTVTVNTENVKSISKPALPRLDAFSVVNESSSTRTSISIVNGKTTRNRELKIVYTLKPLKKGTFAIDPIIVQFKGETYSTDPVTVKVVEGHVAKKTEGYMLDEGTSLDIEKLKNEIFILAGPADSEIYEGQQLVLAYVLYSRLDIDAIALKQTPEFSGFYKEDIYNATKLENRRETYKGQVYNTTLLKKVALFPLRPGTYALKPLVLDTTVTVKDEDLYGFFGRPYSFQVMSNDVTINVNPLPKKEKDFTGVVGELSYTITGRDRSIGVGESTACYLIMKSTGNIGAISAPEVSLSKRARAYLSDTKTDMFEEGDKLYLTKKFEYTIIPEDSGTLMISTDDLLYFDTVEKRYVLVSPDPFQINVTGKSIAEEPVIRKPKRSTDRGSFSFIKGDVKTLKSRSRSFLGSPYYYLYHILLLGWIGVFFGIKSKRESLRRDAVAYKKAKARGTSIQILSKARGWIEEREFNDAVDQIFLGLTTYLAHKCGIAPQDITIKNVRTVIEDNFSIEDSQKEKIAGIVERCISYKFSSERIDDERTILDLYDRTLSAIDSMERT